MQRQLRRIPLSANTTNPAFVEYGGIPFSHWIHFADALINVNRSLCFQLFLLFGCLVFGHH